MNRQNIVKTLLKLDKAINGNAVSYSAKGWSKTRMLKAIRSVKEYIPAEYPAQKQVIPICQYIC